MNEPLQSSPSLSSFGFDPCKDYSLDEKYGAGNMQERLSISPNALPQFSPQSDFVVPAFSAYRISDQVTEGMDRQTAMFAYRIDVGNLSIMPYAHYDMVNAGFMGHYTKMGVGSRMAYEVNDWLTVGMFGQYVPKNSQSIMVAPFDPKTNYGGFVEVMFNQHWGVGYQVSRDYVLQRNGKWKWQTSHALYPVHRK